MPSSWTAETDSAPLMDFMLRMIHEALVAGTPQAAHQVTPQVKQLYIFWPARCRLMDWLTVGFPGSPDNLTGSKSNRQNPWH